MPRFVRALAPLRAFPFLTSARSQYRSLSLLGLVVVGSSIAFSGSSSRSLPGSFNKKLNNATAAESLLSSQEGEKKSDLRVQILTLRPFGFEPNEIKRPKGKFLLAVNDQSQAGEDLTFVLTEERGAELKNVKLDLSGKRKWNNLFDLSAGQYRLSVRNHPEWVCNFIIEDK